MDGLERADLDKRYNAYAVGFGKWLTTDDIRALENLNPYEPPEDPSDVGKILLWPLNMGSAKNVANPPAPPAAGDVPSPQRPSLPSGGEGTSSQRGTGAASSRRALAKAQRISLTDVVERVLRRESADIQSRSRKRANPPEWLDIFYDEHRAYIVRQVGPQFRAYAALIEAEISRELGKEAKVPDAFVAKYIDGYAQRHIAASAAESKLLLGGSAKDMESALLTWPGRSEWLALREANQAGNAFAVAAYRDAGISTLCWVAGDDCADCPGLHGKEVPIDGKFAQRGELSDDRFVPAAGLGHPPLCDGCECVVLAVGPVLNDSAIRLA